MKNKNLEPNKEFAFLYRTTRFRPMTISLLAQVPEFMDALRRFRNECGFLDEDSVYEITSSVYIQMLAEGKRSAFATNVMNKISKDVTGDSSTWRNKIEKDEGE